jgi:hypothetical protein
VNSLCGKISFSYFSESSSALKELYTMVKWALFQGSEAYSIFENLSV